MAQKSTVVTGGIVGKVIGCAECVCEPAGILLLLKETDSLTFPYPHGPGATAMLYFHHFFGDLRDGRFATDLHKGAVALSLQGCADTVGVIEHVQCSISPGTHSALVAGVSLPGRDFHHVTIPDMYIDAAVVAAHAAKGFDDSVINGCFTRHRSSALSAGMARIPSRKSDCLRLRSARELMLPKWRAFAMHICTHFGLPPHRSHLVAF